MLNVYEGQSFDKLDCFWLKLSCSIRWQCRLNDCAGVYGGCVGNDCAVVIGGSAMSESLMFLQEMIVLESLVAAQSSE